MIDSFLGGEEMFEGDTDETWILARGRVALYLKAVHAPADAEAKIIELALTQTRAILDKTTGDPAGLAVKMAREALRAEQRSNFITSTSKNSTISALAPPAFGPWADAQAMPGINRGTMKPEELNRTPWRNLARIKLAPIRKAAYEFVAEKFQLANQFALAFLAVGLRLTF